MALAKILPHSSSAGQGCFDAGAAVARSKVRTSPVFAVAAVEEVEGPGRTDEGFSFLKSRWTCASYQLRMRHDIGSKNPEKTWTREFS